MPSKRHRINPGESGAAEFLLLCGRPQQQHRPAMSEAIRAPAVMEEIGRIREFELRREGGGPDRHRLLWPRENLAVCGQEITEVRTQEGNTLATWKN